MGAVVDCGQIVVEFLEKRFLRSAGETRPLNPVVAPKRVTTSSMVSSRATNGVALPFWIG